MKKTFNEFCIEKGFSAEQLEKMEANEIAGLYNEFNALKSTAIEEAIAEKVTKSEVDSMRSELLKAQTEQLKSLNEVLKEQGIAIKRMSEGEIVESKKGLSELLKENLEGLKTLKHSSSANDNVKIELKAVGDMSITGNVTGQVPQAMRLAGMNEIATRQVRLLDVVQKGAISSSLVEWVYQANKEGGAGQTSEGAIKNQLDFDLIVGSQKVEKSTAFVTVTDEMLDDVDFMKTAIENELRGGLMRNVENQVYQGSGVSPQLMGIKTVATAFAGGSFAGTIDNANEVDVLTVATNQIVLANQDAPNYIFMNPSDVTALKMVKVSSTDKRYVERLAMVGGSLSLDGIPIIPTTLVTQGEYLIGDFMKSFVLEKQGVTLEIGYNADNFVKNYKTIRAEWRGVSFVKHNDRTAFVSGVFATDKAVLETL